MRRRTTTEPETTHDRAPAGPVTRLVDTVRARLGLAPRPAYTDREVLDMVLNGQVEVWDQVSTLNREVLELHLKLDTIETQLGELTAD